MIVHSLRDTYAYLLNHIEQQGAIVEPRGRKTYEIVGFHMELENVVDTLPVGIGRGVSLPFAAAEAAQLIGGFSDPEILTRINPTMQRFREDSGVFHGAYGPRIRDGLVFVEHRLRRDPDTRQAVVTIWRNERDATDHVPRDLPCTIALHFLLRKDRLQLHTYMRSNDVWWGLAYDVFQFTQLQLTMCNVLGVEPGSYFHNATSLHLYHDDLENADHVEYPAPGSHGVLDATGFPGRSMYEAADAARDVFYLQRSWPHVNAHPSFTWYEEQIRRGLGL